MTVHWNSRKGFVNGPNTASSAAEPAADGDAASLAELQVALRKSPAMRTAQLNRARKLLADPKYPSRELLKKVAILLARHWAARSGD